MSRWPPEFIADGKIVRLQMSRLEHANDLAEDRYNFNDAFFNCLVGMDEYGYNVPGLEKGLYAIQGWDQCSAYSSKNQWRSSKVTYC